MPRRRASVPGIFAPLALVLACSASPGDAGGGTGSSATGTTSTTAASEGSGPSDTTSMGSTGGAPLPMPGPDVDIPAFSAEHVYFLPDDNRRQVDVEVEFPESDLSYETVTLSVDLTCPNGDACDWWDRLGWIGIVENAGTDDERIVELARFVTPYRIGAAWSFDLTMLRPLLAGPRTIRLFIDTWVGPGHANGEGWVVDATFAFRGGVPDPLPVWVLPVWHQTTFESGNPAAPYTDHVPPADVALPEPADVVLLQSLITGHGQGNAENCAEFCQKTHGFLVGDLPVQRVVWRDDCDQTPAQPQQGTWTYPRAGWCPGAEVRPWVEDVTAGVAADGTASIVYAMSDYENTCRPDAPVCMGCTLGTGCEYDGGNHTMPRYVLSAHLVGARTLP
ncbi:MAG: hypothetical protein D6705_13265 [Deltaproteobacteria bacterium]|nr:MAG: hypothetical protein D6705_13265 [Deltaproteobacteria bacterium]